MSRPEPIPTLPTLPIVANVHLIDTAAPTQSLMQLAEQHGGIFSFKMPAGRELIIVSEPDLVAELCDTERFEKAVHPLLKELRGLAGDGLFTADSDAEAWGVAHRVLMPAFGPVAIRGMFDQMVDIADQMMLRWSRFGPETAVDVADDMTRLTLDTIALCAFDFRFNSFYSDTLHPFVDAMVSVLLEADARTNRPDLLNHLLVGPSRRYRDHIDQMHTLADQLVATRRARPPEQAPADLLSRMLHRTDPITGKGLSDENIRHQMITFLIAGHETTSGLLSFATWFLLEHPEVLAKARAVVDEVVGDRPLTVHHLPRLGYLEQVLKETLRIWPTAPAFGLQPKGDQVLGGRYAVTPEDALVVLTPTLHRHPGAWTDPLAFRPERFAPTAEQARPDHIYKPFGHGARACIGRAFAMQEAVIVLAKMLQRFDLELADPNYRLVVKETLTLKPGHLRIRARPRTAPAARPAATTPAASRATASHPLLVLYGSDTGTGETFARQLAEEARQRGTPVTLGTLDDHAGALPTSQPVVLFTSSYLGQPPRNARRFAEWLDTLDDNALKGVQHAVFGCGDRNWRDTYQAVPRRFDAALSAAGSTALLPRGEGDASADLLGAYDTWKADLWRVLAPASAPDVAAHLQVNVVDPDAPVLAGPSHLQPATVVENVLLTARGATATPQRRHLELTLPDGATYRAGDYLLVQPENPPAIVERVLARFSLQPDTHLLLRRSSGATSLPVGRPVTAGVLFARCVELSRPATRALLARMVQHTRCPPERASLQGLLDHHEVAVLHARVSPLELLERHPACMLPLADFLDALPPLRPRQYSISSSPLWKAGRCTLTVTVVEGPAKSGRGRFQGVASSFLARLIPGETVRVAVVHAPPSFQLPSEPDVPIILVGAGSGIAPLRSFLQERQAQAAQGAQVAESLLFFGCDHPELDFLYREELETWVQSGHLKVFPAFSSQPEGGITFVQHRLWAERDRVADQLAHGARVYVCGSRPMAEGVREVVVDIAAEAHGGDRARAESWFRDLQDGGQYAEDVFS